jgi:hypothetical protein
VALVVTFAIGVIAATDSAAWYVRLIALVVFLAGMVVTLDVLC